MLYNVHVAVAEWLARLTAVWEDPGSNHTADDCVYYSTAAAIYSLGHRLCTLISVPRSTQPSTLRGTVKWVSAYGLSNNNRDDGGFGW